MKKKIIMIVGETASGKDKIAKYLNDKFNIPALVSYTTRPMRDSEINGKEHWFVTPDEMAEILKNQDIFAYTKIEDKTQTNVDGYEYCTTIDSIHEEIVSYIIDPDGIKSISKNKEIKNKFEAIVLYVYVPYEIRKERAQKSRSDFQKFETRNLQECKQFQRFRENKEYDYLIENLDIDIAYKQVENAVKSFLKK